MRIILLIAMLLAVAVPVAAQSPQDMIRWVYTSLSEPGPLAQKGLFYMASPQQRSTYFTQRMVAFLDANDSYGDDLAAACVDFGFAIPGNDFDADEVRQSLHLSTQQGANQIIVFAAFTSFGKPVQIIYEFVPEDGFWKIDDIASDGWRVSDIPCAPKAQAPAAVQANTYCYQSGDDALKIEVLPGNRARIEFMSWQANGHSCSGRLDGHQVTDGWHFPGEQECFLRLRMGADGSLNLIDPDFACKRYMCGQRAVIDGLRFPQASQVECLQYRGFEN